MVRRFTPSLLLWLRIIKLDSNITIIDNNGSYEERSLAAGTPDSEICLTVFSEFRKILAAYCPSGQFQWLDAIP